MLFSKIFRCNACLFLFCFLCYIMGLTIYMKGLVSSSTSKLKPIPQQNLHKVCSQAVSEDTCSFQGNMLQTFYSNHYQKVIIVVIDALRADFIPSIKYNAKFNLSMPFTETLLRNGSAVSLLMRGFAPTVTLPRIKTLVTGTISNFLDILLNFNAVELSDDNILKQASLNGLKSVFYGDDTWLKLFPNLFIRSEGTHSFYVSDFKQVDLNVSRHINFEITREDWNVLILHFLGVDHIGHAYGPFSKHLAPKLIEMDEIIKYMYENLKSVQQSSLIVICGDHGMTTSGSHGGITEEELLTPLIFIDTADHQGNLKPEATIDQVDFAPTLSALLGLPIPVNSCGKVIPSVLQFAGFSSEKILYTVYYNFLQISNVYNNFFPAVSKHLYSTREVIENHYEWFQKERNHSLSNSDYIYLLNSYEMQLTDMKKDLLGISTGYNEVSMLLGLTIMWVSLSLSIQILLPSDFCNNSVVKILVNKRFLVFLFLIIAVCIYHMLSTVIIISLLTALVMFICQVSFLLFNIVDKNSVAVIQKIIIVFLLMHALSLFSSSYIEEEHQTWYYFTCSIAVILCYQRFHSYLKGYLMNRPAQVLLALWRECYSTALNVFLVLLIHRIFCKWNQVGNKWQHLPDISDWLNQRENVTYLGIFLLLSQFILMLYFLNKLNKFSYFLFSSSLVCITLQKMNNSDLFSYFSDYTYTMLIPWVVYIFSILIVMLSFIQLYTSSFLLYENAKLFLLHFLAAWILLVEIIGRVYNIPLITVVIVQEHFLSKVLWIQNCSITNNVLCYFFISMASFFYYGNSNSFSTIDVVTGYTGVQSYSPVVIGFLLFCNTYSTKVMWLLLIPHRILQLKHFMNDSEYLVKRIKFTFLILLDYKLFILSLYSIIMYLMRHHLFIYSVFFPKLFYEFCHVIMIVIICLLISFILNKTQ